MYSKASNYQKNVKPCNWAIPENIRTVRRTAFWNSEGKWGFFELEFRRHGGVLTIGILKASGGFSSGISRGYRQVILWAFLFLFREQA